MYLKSTRVFKLWEQFYKDWQVFKWHLRKTMIDARREYEKLWWYKYSNCPKTIRRTYKEDYQAFKERWWDQDIYVKVSGQYDSDVNMWQFQVVLPTYKIDSGRIKTIYNETRGRYPLWLLDCVLVDKLPRETDWVIEPGEKYTDCIDKYWRDSDMFVALSWQHAERKLSNDDAVERFESASMTWAWKEIANQYNGWYRYVNWQLVEVQTIVEEIDDETNE